MKSNTFNINLSNCNNCYLLILSVDYYNNDGILGASVFIFVVTNIIAKDRNLNYYWVTTLFVNLLRNRSYR